MLDAYNESYGCETGCMKVRIVVVCEKCNRNVYVKGDFGEFGNDAEKKQYLDEVEDAEIIKAILNKLEDQPLPTKIHYEHTTRYAAGTISRMVL